MLQPHLSVILDSKLFQESLKTKNVEYLELLTFTFDRSLIKGGVTEGNEGY